MEWIEITKWIIGLSVVILSLAYTIRHFKIVRTVAYIERFNTPSMIETRVIVKEWCKLNDEKKIIELESDTELYYKVNLIYNLITEIGISYKFRIINRRITQELFDPLIPLYYESIKPYIYLNRKKGIKLGFYALYITNSILKNRSKNTKKYAPIKINIIKKDKED